MDDHPLVGRRIRLLHDHVVKWEAGEPVVIHKAKTEAIIVGVPDALDPAFPYPVIEIDVEGFQPHRICVKIPDRDGKWDANIELVLRKS